MCDIGFLIPKSHGPNKPLHLDGLAREALSDKGGFRDHPLPRLRLGFSGLEDLEHLVFSDTADFRERYGVFRSLLFPFLLDGRGEGFGVLLALAIEQVGR